jgi:molecular chaperone GrpE
MVEEDNRYVYEEDEVSAEEQIESLKKELEEQKAKAEANLAGWQRAQADLANYKRRSDQEREESVKFANANLVLKLLPIFDDFERAVAHLPDDLGDNPWVEGVKLIERKLKSCLESSGLSPIEAVCQPFDPRFHEAIREVPGEEGMVVAEAQKGYKFLDRVIRASKVFVGNGEHEDKSTEESSKDIQ